MKPAPTLVVEGLLTLYYRGDLDLKLFVEAADFLMMKGGSFGTVKKVVTAHLKISFLNENNSIFASSLEKLRNISTKKQWLAISLGIALGVLILGSTVYCQKPAKDFSEQTDKPEAETVSTLDFNAVQSNTQTALERTYYLIETLPEVDERTSEDVTEESFFPSPARVFKILSEHIISPNSP